jgi:hypothetical protein
MVLTRSFLATWCACSMPQQPTIYSVGQLQQQRIVQTMLAAAQSYTCAQPEACKDRSHAQMHTFRLLVGPHAMMIDLHAYTASLHWTGTRSVRDKSLSQMLLATNESMVMVSVHVTCTTLPSRTHLV